MERELKYRLADRSAYETLLGALAGEPPLIQKNYYFDSADGRLGGAGRSALRIRGEGPNEAELAWEVTLKVGVSKEGAYFQAHEWNAPLPAELVPAMLEGGLWPDAVLALLPMQKYQEHFAGGPLVGLGGIVNRRVRCSLFEDQVAEVDETCFPDGSIDFEVEVETERPQEVEAYLQSLSASLGLTLGTQDKTKFRRFLERRVASR